MVRIPITGHPFLEAERLTNSFTRKKFQIVDNTCPNKLIKLTFQKLKEIEPSFALFPKINWNIIGRNRVTIIVNFIMSFCFNHICNYCLSTDSASIFRNYAHGGIYLNNFLRRDAFLYFNFLSTKCRTGGGMATKGVGAATYPSLRTLSGLQPSHTTETLIGYTACRCWHLSAC